MRKTVVIAAVALLLCGYGCDKGDGKKDLPQGVTVSAAPGEGPRLPVGQACVIKTSGYTNMAATEADYDESGKAALKGGDASDQLRKAGKFWLVPADTNCEIVGPGKMTYQVRITGGPLEGKTGFIGTPFVKPAPAGPTTKE